MRLRFGPKQWTWHQQHGLRLYAGPIRRLAPHVPVPDRRRIYRTMQEFVDGVDRSGLILGDHEFTRDACLWCRSVPERLDVPQVFRTTLIGDL